MTPIPRLTNGPVGLWAAAPQLGPPSRARRVTNTGVRERRWARAARGNRDDRGPGPTRRPGQGRGAATPAPDLTLTTQASTPLGLSSATNFGSNDGQRRPHHSVHPNVRDLYAPAPTSIRSEDPFRLSLNVRRTHVSTTVGRRPRGGAPSPPCPLAFGPKAKRPPVSPGDSGPRTHAIHRPIHCRSGHGPHAETGETAAVPTKRRPVSHQDHLSHTWVPESGASQVCVPVNAGVDEPVVP